MTDQSALNDDVVNKETETQDQIDVQPPKITGEDIRAARAEDLRSRVASGLGGLKIRAANEEVEASDISAITAVSESIAAIPASIIPLTAEQEIKTNEEVVVEDKVEQVEKTPEEQKMERREAIFSAFQDDADEDVEVDAAIAAALPSPRMGLSEKAMYITASVLTCAWFGFYFFAAIQNGGISLVPAELGSFFAGLCAPPALLWMMISSMHRRSEVNIYAASLRQELQSLLFPSEETAVEINKDIERLCRQASEVSSASKAVLKSLQRARQGLRVEIRDFSGVSKKTEFHIDRLAESLNDRVSKLSELTNEIEKRTGEVEARTQAGAEAWDRATLNALERAGEIENAMDSGIDKLLEAADKAKGKAGEIETGLSSTYDSLNKAVDEVGERLESVSTRFDDHASSLSRATDHVSEEAGRLSETIRDQIEGLEDVTDRTIEAMARSSETISDHRQALDNGAQAVADQSDKIANTILESVNTLTEKVAEIEARSSNIERRIEEKTSALSKVVSGIADEATTIEEAGKYAANQLSEALVTAVSGADTISSAVRRSVESLESSTIKAKLQADDLIEATSNQVAQLNNAAAGNLDSVKEIVAMLENSREQIEEVAVRTQDHVRELAQTVSDQNDQITMSGASLSERLEKVKRSLTEPLKDIQAAIVDTDQRHANLENTLSRRVSDLNDASDKAAQTAENIRSVLRGQVQEISTLSGQVAASARTINEQMGEQKDSLSTQVTDALAMINRANEALNAQSNSLVVVAQNAEEKVASLRDEIASRCEDIAAYTTTTFAQLEKVEESMDDKILHLKRRAEDASTSILTVKRELTEATKEMEPIYIRTIQQADQVQERFNTLKTSYEGSTESNILKLKQVGDFFDERLIAIKEGSESVSENLRMTTDQLKSRVNDIENASLSANDSMREVSARLEDQTADMALISDKVLLKVEGVQNALNDQFHELSASVGQAVVQMSDAGHQFIKQSEIIQDEADKIAGQFEYAGEKAREEAGLLNEATHKTVVDTELLVGKVQEVTQALLARSGETLFELKQTGDSFSMRAREVAEQMKVSLSISEKYGRELRQQAGLIAETTAESSEHLDRSISMLKSRMGEIGTAAGDLGVKVEHSREKLAGEAERLISVSTAALETTKEAAQSFGRQADSLFKASQDAARYVNEIQRKTSRSQSEAFMSSAKFVIESLHSLSVDMTRIMDGDISERTWKAYQRGDVSAFTRRLVEMKETMPIEKAREKFSKDTEFRTYLQRFIRQFEEMYEQALDNDHAALLVSMIGSSELGKLYEALCEVAGREAVTHGKGARLVA